MWQGEFSVATKMGEPIFWSRWLFYGATCTLLMLEIAHVKGFKGGKLVEILFLTVIVMFTGFLAARDLTLVRWIYFIVSSVAYTILVIQIQAVRAKEARWVTPYILFGWTVFPIVFLLAPEGLGVISSLLANILYLGLDIYTKIIFSFQLMGKSQSTVD
jgi:sensory rhodopsin